MHTILNLLYLSLLTYIYMYIWINKAKIISRYGGYKM